MSNGYDFYLDKALEGLGHVDSQGGSGYFSEPSTTLDPHIFSDDEKLRSNVRTWIIGTLYKYWRRYYSDPEGWSRIWLAGSGISYQWSADRSNGDLDVLIGVDWPRFFEDEDGYRGLTVEQAASDMDRNLKDELWPQTAASDLNGAIYEVTFFVKAGGTDIRDINAYAAYDVTSNSWTVRPPQVSTDPASAFPQQWWDQVHAEQRNAQQLVERYNRLSDQLRVQDPTGPGWLNSIHQMGLITDQARAMFDDIHLGRRKAFAPGGTGFLDYHNFRWQAHKRVGTVQALHAIAEAQRGAQRAMETDLYGEPLKGADEALVEAMLWSRRHAG